MLEHDRSNFLKLLKEFPQQIIQSVDLMKSFNAPWKSDDIQHLVFSGMGGSAIAGDLLLGYLEEQIKIPSLVNRTYNIPYFVNDKTLFVAISFSGNTEETISATRAAINKNAKVLGISSGGELQEICKSNNYPHIQITGGLPPRQALGYLFFSLLLALEKMGFVNDQAADIEETIHLASELVHRFDPKRTYNNNLANHIAQSIYHAIPITYTGAPYLHGVSVRWRNQFNENSKVIAFSNELPELNHNEIMGWEGLPEVNKHFRVILLRCPDEHERIKERFKITKEILKANKILFGEVFAEGNSHLARMFSLIIIGDWASYYLALHNGKDPMLIKSIDYLKEKLGSLPV
jgi:glucose/mannose-6-phosphate isomerase